MKITYSVNRLKKKKMAENFQSVLFKNVFPPKILQVNGSIDLRISDLVLDHMSKNNQAFPNNSFTKLS